MNPANMKQKLTFCISGSLRLRMYVHKNSPFQNVVHVMDVLLYQMKLLWGSVQWIQRKCSTGSQRS